jgi:MFS family permease
MLLKQPRAVYAVAFACVVSFMGIGLVDPILPALSAKLDATPSQVSLLFTSYLLVTAVAMLFTGWVASRIGAKPTLITGLALIVVFAALAGLSGSIDQIVGFRAGWGLGNALFIATSLAVIVASATGGFAGAIVLYEAALGLGIAAGPLIGGLLGEVSWRGPFFGGGLAPFAAGEMVDRWNIHVPFVIGAVVVLLGVAVLTTGHRPLAEADAAMAASASASVSAPAPAPDASAPGGALGSADDVAGEVADEFGGAPDAIDHAGRRRDAGRGEGAGPGRVETEVRAPR